MSLKDILLMQKLFNKYLIEIDRDISEDGLSDTNVFVLKVLNKAMFVISADIDSRIETSCYDEAELKAMQEELNNYDSIC